MSKSAYCDSLLITPPSTTHENDRKSKGTNRISSLIRKHNFELFGNISWSSQMKGTTSIEDLLNSNIKVAPFCSDSSPKLLQFWTFQLGNFSMEELYNDQVEKSRFGILLWRHSDLFGQIMAQKD